MAVRGWPHPTALRTDRRGGRWQPFEPDFPLVRPYRPRRPRSSAASPQLALPIPADEIVVRPRRTPARQRARAFARFRFSLPREVAAALEPVRHQQWCLLWLLAHCEEALELTRSNPALAFCVAARCHRLRRSDPAILHGLPDILSRKRRDLLGWLRFPATSGTAKLMARIDPASLSRRAMVRLRGALASPEVAKRLAHLPHINAGVLAIVSEPRLLAATTPSLLAEVAASRRERHYPFVAEQLADSLDMLADLHPGATRRFASLARLQREHDELGVAWCRLERDRIRRCRFPRPPVPGNARIVPLETPDALIAEGERQDNCVATYASRVQARQTYIYRVLGPERATLSIVPGPGRSWRRGELLAAGNREVDAETKSAVDRWLEGHAL